MVIELVLCLFVSFLLCFLTTDGLPPPPTSVMADDEPLPPPPMKATVTPIYESTSSKNHPTSSTNVRSPFVFGSQSDRSYDWIPKVYIEKGMHNFTIDNFTIMKARFERTETLRG